MSKGEILGSFKRRRLAVTQRDEKLFAYLFVNKVAAVEDIRKDIFGGVAVQTVHRRLVKLSHAGFVEASGQREKGNRMIYSLTKKGFREYIAEDKAIKRVQLKSDSVEHDLTLLEIKRYLRALEMVLGVYSENLFKSGLMDDVPEVKKLKELWPDAIVKIKFEEKTLFLPLEYEASAKYSRRNDKLLAKYNTSPHVLGVIFISKTAAIERRVLQKEKTKGTKPKGKLYYCRLEDVVKSERKLTLTNALGDILILS